MLTIIRIQHLDGNGLYYAKDDSGHNYFNRLSCNRDIEMHHFFFFPSARKDSGIRRRPEKNELHGFKDIEQFQAWIKKEWIKDLIENGFKILKLQVSKAIIGETQVLFKREDVLHTSDISSSFTS